MAESGALDLKTTLELMRQVDAARITGKAVEAYIFLDRAAVKEQLMQRLEAQGSHPDDRYLDSAIAAWEEAQNRFLQPRHSLSHTIAEVYVKRGVIARRVGIPLATFAVLAAAILSAVQGVSSLIQSRAEGSVEAKVEQLYRQDGQLGEQVISLRDSPVAAELPAGQAQEFASYLGSAGARLDSVDAFLREVAPGGHADDAVTRSNYQVVSAHADTIEQQLKLAKEDVDAASKLIQAKQKLVQLSADAERLYAAIRAIAKEPAAFSKAEGLYGEARQYSSVSDASNLASAIGGLSDLELVLQQEYTLIITGGDKRCRDDPKYSKQENIGRCEKGLNPQNFYVFVDSVGTKGKLVAASVRDEELGSTLEVTHWGERVPEAVYREVERDFKDNGHFDRKELGVKQRGFLTARLKYDGKELQQIGQITRKGN